MRCRGRRCLPDHPRALCRHFLKSFQNQAVDPFSLLILGLFQCWRSCSVDRLPFHRALLSHLASPSSLPTKGFGNTENWRCWPLLELWLMIYYVISLHCWKLELIVHLLVNFHFFPFETFLATHRHVSILATLLVIQPKDKSYQRTNRVLPGGWLWHFWVDQVGPTNPAAQYRGNKPELQSQFNAQLELIMVSTSSFNFGKCFEKEATIHSNHSNPIFWSESQTHFQWNSE